MELFNLCIDPTEFKKKPTPFETSRISLDIAKNPVKASLSEIIQAIEKGQSLMLSELSGSTLKSKLISQQIFFLDVDNNDSVFSWEEALEHSFIKENACFMYKTFSNSSDRVRFRIAFVTENKIYQKENSLEIYESLMEVFPTVDKSTKNYNRIFYGTNSKVKVININNRLNVFELLKNNLSPDILEAKEILVSDDLDEVINIPNWVLIKLGEDAILSEKLSKYGKELADVTQFSEYFKRIDLGEFLELPTGGAFNDIFHDEENPSASIFKLPSGIQLYKCHSENNHFVGDLIRVVSRLRNCGIISSLNYLIRITGSTELIPEELKELRDSIDILKNLLLSEDLKEQYPELDKYVSNYRTDMVSILDILKTSTYWDIETKEYRALFYYSSKTLASKLGYSEGNKNQKRVQRVLNLMTYMMFIDKLTAEETPNLLLHKLEKTRKENKRSRRVNVIEAKKFTDESFEIIFEQCKKMFDEGFTVGGFNREYLLRNESIYVADRVFPQETKVLGDKEMMYDYELVLFIFTHLGANNYVLEKDVRSYFSKLIKSNAVSDAKWKTIRTDILNKYNLKRVRLNKNLKSKYHLEGLPSTSSPFIIVNQEEN